MIIASKFSLTSKKHSKRYYWTSLRLFYRSNISYPSYSSNNTQKIAEEKSSCFQNRSSLVQISISDEVTEISSNCFYGCSKLQSIEIHYSIIAFKNYCFFVLTLLRLSFLAMLLKFIFFVFGHALSFNVFIFFSIQFLKKSLFNCEKIQLILLR
jgi:hypothetical protein